METKSFNHADLPCTWQFASLWQKIQKKGRKWYEILFIDRDWGTKSNEKTKREKKKLHHDFNSVESSYDILQI